MKKLIFLSIVGSFAINSSFPIISGKDDNVSSESKLKDFLGGVAIGAAGGLTIGAVIGATKGKCRKKTRGPLIEINVKSKNKKNIFRFNSNNNKNDKIFNKKFWGQEITKSALNGTMAIVISAAVSSGATYWLAHSQNKGKDSNTTLLEKNDKGIETPKKE